MKLVVSDIPDDGLHHEFRRTLKLKINGHPADADVFMRIIRIDRKVMIEGTIRSTPVLQCCRCLKEYMFSMDLEFRDEYNPAEEVLDEENMELGREDLDLSYYREDEIDLEEVTEEQVLLSIPMKPLCNAGCAGICSKCGKDLNEGPCGCAEKTVDPRLAPLEKLRQATENRKE